MRMMRFAQWGLAAAVMATAVSSTLAQAPPAPNTVDLRPAPDIPGVIKGGTIPEIVVRGLRSADDPLWLPNVGLIFSESQANRVVRLDERDQVSTFVGDLHNPLGMTVDGLGRVISLQTATGYTGPRVIWPAGREMVIADQYQGQRFTRPNDITSNRQGGVYFSDLPPAGQAPPGMPGAVYYVPPGGAAIRVADSVTRPNGVILSRDEKTLYVNDTGGIHAHAFDVLPDGRLSSGRVFVTYVGRDRTVVPPAPPISQADGLAIDSEGRLYGLTEAGVEVASASGQHLGIIPVWCITRRCQNLTFGGPDKGTLYVAGGGTLLRLSMLSRGFAGRVK